jgi:hypothetical protein
MGGCSTYGPLIGGYALGALEPEEMEEMRRHVAVCPQCGPEAHRLEGLPWLLDRIAPADVPPPTLSPEVEEAVLDRFARERREGGAGGASGRRAGRPTRRPALLGRPPGSLRRPVAVAAACLIALVVALALVLPGGDDDGTAAYATVSLDPSAGGAGAATAWLDEAPAGTRIRLETRGLSASSEYEVWCIATDGRWVSGGTFRADRDGRVEAELTAAVKPGDYHRMVVTRRPEGAGGAERGEPVLDGELRY